MRVITGKAGRKALLTLEGDDVVRPTSGKVKEGVFSAIQFEIEGSTVLDLFAGSGQLGIEALSRGAKHTYFVDASKQSFGIIKKNLENTKLADDATVFHGDFASFLAFNTAEFDIAFIDPPYKSGLYEKALNNTEPFMKDTGVMICEHPISLKLPDTVGEFIVSKKYTYGKISVTMYRKG